MAYSLTKTRIATGLKRRLNRKSLAYLDMRESRRAKAEASAAARLINRLDEHPRLCRKSFSTTGPCAAMCADCAAFEIPPRAARIRMIP